MIYDKIGESYSTYRVPDKRIAELIHNALGDAGTVLNIGAGTGSYEPGDLTVKAVEPSATMINQRPRGSAPVVQASAEDLPFMDKQFDAAMAILTIHHWHNWRKGIQELRRVANKCVILTWDPDSDGFWLTQEYFPEILTIDRAIFPSLDDLKSVLGDFQVSVVPIPHDCTDGFGSAYWRRPDAYLSAGVRNAMSTFTKIQNLEAGLNRLKSDLATGLWHKKHSHLLNYHEYDLGYRLICATWKV